MINLPSDMLEVEQFKVMPAIEKDTYLDKVIKKILDLNPNGITVPLIAKSLGMNVATIWRHLEKLTSTREAYKLNFGKTIIYYPNGKMIHHFKQEDILIGEKTYSFFYILNNFGKFLYLQEKRQDRLGTFEVVGGLLIPSEKIEDFISALMESNQEIKKMEKKK